MDLITNLLLVITAFFQTISPPQTKIYFFDVGQGDSTYIQLKTGEKILVDGGPDYSSDALLFQHYSTISCSINLVILTHPHADHLFGLNRILERCDAQKILHNKVEHSSKLYQNWLALLEESFNDSGVTQGDTFELGEVNMYILWPPKDYVTSNLNNYSVVTLLDFGNIEVLLPGDAEVEVLEQVMHYMQENTEKFIEDDVVEIFKFPHHGAINGLSNDLIKFLNPQHVVFSSGENNKYGHPHKDSISAVSNFGAEIYRTDLDGTIIFILSEL